MEFHRKLNITKSHVLVDCSSHNTGNYKAPQLLSTYMVCPNHMDKTVEFICKEHNTVCCPSCATINHRTCQHVVEIKKTADGSKVKRHIDKLRDHLVETSSCIEEIVTVNDKCRKDLGKSKREIPKMLEQMKMTFLDLFDRMKVALIEKVNSLHVDEDVVSEDREESWKVKHKATADLLKMFDAIIEIGTDSQTFVVLHKMKGTILDTEKALANQGHHVVGKTLTLKMKDILEHVIQTEFIDDLVAVETVKNQFHLPKTRQYNKRAVVDEATLTSDTIEEEGKETYSRREMNKGAVFGMYM